MFIVEKEISKAAIVEKPLEICLYERIDNISSFVENGSPDVLDKPCSVLRDVGHSDILKSISPCDIHIKAGKITIKSAFHLITCIDFYKNKLRIFI